MNSQAVELIQEIEMLGVELTIKDKNIQLSGPKGAITDKHKERLIQAKSEIISLLKVRTGKTKPARLAVSNKAIITPSVNNRRPVLHLVREVCEDGQVKKVSYTLIGKSGESVETVLNEHKKRFPGQKITRGRK